MKREFLKELGLESEVIQKIMDANGADIEAAKAGLTAKDAEITDLKQQIASRDTDIQKLKDDLTAAQTDAGKLDAVTKNLTDLQAKYEQDKTALEAKLAAQQYGFMVRERANTLNFSSKAAKNEFIRQATEKGFKVDGDTLLGYEDFVAKYKTDDPGAFTEEKKPDTEPQPRIVAPVSPKNNASTNPFEFHFAGVRPHETK